MTTLRQLIGSVLVWCGLVIGGDPLEDDLTDRLLRRDAASKSFPAALDGTGDAPNHQGDAPNHQIVKETDDA